MADSDFNPGFSFDFGGGSAQQPTWEFAGALKQAYQDNPQTGTSIDQKIAKQIKRKQEIEERLGGKSAPGKKGAAKAQPAGKHGGKAAAKRESDDDDDFGGDSDDESDEPLPGELDSDDEEEEEEEAGVSEDEDEDDEEDEDDGDDGAGASSSGDDEDNTDVDMEDDGSDDDEDDGSDDDEDEDEDAAVSDEPPSGSADVYDADEEEDVDEEEDSEEEEEEARPSKRARQEQQDAASKKQKQQDKAAKQDGNKATAAANKKGKGKASFYAETPEGTTFSAASFADLALSRPLLKAVAALGFTKPTPIQAACIPIALAGRDVCGSAVTGSGKTAAFALPFLERLIHRPRGVAATYVVVLTPTRELAVQVHSMVEKLAQYTDVSVALIVGGLSLQVQAATLRRQPEVIVATPGRLIDHLRNSQGFGLEDLAVLVLDEADRLLEMGFKEEIGEIVRMAPRKRQTLLFSATFTAEVRALAALSLKQPVRLAADVALAAPKQLSQEIVRLKGGTSMQKEAALLALVSRSFKDGRTIVFTRTKQRAHRLKIMFGLAQLPPAAELHGNMSQTARLESLEAFRQGKVAYLLATDVAARGLDIQGVQVVLNYDAPRKLETYLHRIGRTARAGASGVAVTFAEDNDRALIKDVLKKTGVNMKQRLVPQQAIDQWQGRVEKYESSIASILAEERHEADLRKAEMETAKAANLLEHEDEIFARPKRTWFQTEREKKELAKKSAAVAAGRAAPADDEEEGDDDDDMNEDEGKGKGGKLSKADRKAALKQEKAAKAGEAAKKKPQRGAQVETEEHQPMIRSIKTRVRQLVQEHGMNARAAARLAAQQVTGIKAGSKKKDKAKKKNEGSLFSGDGLGKSDDGEGGAGKGLGGASGGSSKSNRAGKSKQEINKIKRQGKGKKAFKSKARFKRR